MAAEKQPQQIGCATIALLVAAFIVLAAPVWGIQTLTGEVTASVVLPGQGLLDNTTFNCGTPYNPLPVPEWTGGSLVEGITRDQINARGDCADAIGSAKLVGWGALIVGIAVWGGIGYGTRRRWVRRRAERAAAEAGDGAVAP